MRIVFCRRSNAAIAGLETETLSSHRCNVEAVAAIDLRPVLVMPEFFRSQLLE